MSIRTATTISTATVPLATTTTTAIPLLGYGAGQSAVNPLWSIEHGQPGQQLPAEPLAACSPQPIPATPIHPPVEALGSNLLAQALGLIQAMVKFHSFISVQFAAVEYRSQSTVAPWLLNESTQSTAWSAHCRQRNGVPSTSSNSTVSPSNVGNPVRSAAGTMVEPDGYTNDPTAIRKRLMRSALGWRMCMPVMICVITGRQLLSRHFDS